MKHSIEEIENLSFDLMCWIEPELNRLVNLAETHKSLSETEREHYWYRDLKKQMMRIVGFDSKKPALSSPKCYDIVYHKLIDILGI
jgi:hypothetical protein